MAGFKGFAFPPALGFVILPKASGLCNDRRVASRATQYRRVSNWSTTELLAYMRSSLEDVPVLRYVWHSWYHSCSMC